MDVILGVTTRDRCGKKMEKGQNILIVAEGVVADSSEKLDFQNQSVLFACHQECWGRGGAIVENKKAVMMTNADISKILTDIAGLLEKKMENPFKVRAYQLVAQTIAEYPEQMAQLVAENRLREVPGVGEAISKKITELINTGKLDYLEHLRAEVKETTR